jgi:uncharacterized protein
MSQTNVDLIRGLYEAFGRGDGPAILRAMDPGIVWNEAESFPYSDRNPYVGPMAVAEGVFGRIGAEWDQFQAIPGEILNAGDTVVALGRYTGTYKATGKKMNAQFAHVWRVSGGKVTAFQQYTDTAQAVATTRR